MSRAKHFEQYGDIPEVVPGVFVDSGSMVMDCAPDTCWFVGPS